MNYTCSFCQKKFFSKKKSKYCAVHKAEGVDRNNQGRRR